MVQCKAKAKSTGERCTRQAMRGTEVCYVHGGPSPRGTAHPNFKHGRYIKPKNQDALSLGELVARNMGDPDFLSLQGEVALLRARLEQLVAKLETLPKDRQLSYRLAKQAYEKLLGALENPGAPGAAVMMQTGVNLLGKALESQAAEIELWGEVRPTLGALQGLIGQETTRSKIERDFLKSEDAIILLGNVRAAVLDMNPTPEQKAIFAKRMREIMSYQPTLDSGKE